MIVPLDLAYPLWRDGALAGQWREILLDIISFQTSGRHWN